MYIYYFAFLDIEHLMLSMVCYRKGQGNQICCFKERETLKGTTKKSKNAKEWRNVLDDKDIPHILWWKEVVSLFIDNYSLHI